MIIGFKQLIVFAITQNEIQTQFKNCYFYFPNEVF